MQNQTTVNGLSSATLRKAAKLKERIETHEAKLGRILHIVIEAPAPAFEQKPAKRRMSAAGRRAISEGMRRRWRAVRRKGGNAL